MQWLVDLVMDKIRAEGLAVNRGDAPAYDWTHVDLTEDGTWRELDLSGIVPANANCVALSVQAAATTVNKILKFRTAGFANDINRSLMNTQTAAILCSQDLIVYPDANGKIEYNIGPAVWLLIFITVKGWWY